MVLDVVFSESNVETPAVLSATGMSVDITSELIRALITPRATVSKTGTVSTLTVTDINGVTTAQILDGAAGAAGRGITNAVLNADYTLTLTFSDGTTYTTPSIRGEAGEVLSVKVNDVIYSRVGTQTYVDITAAFSTYVTVSTMNAAIVAHHDTTKVDKIEGYGLSKNDYSDAEKAKVTSADSAKHTHSNKNLLDALNQSKVDLWDTVVNKYVLPASGIPSTDMTSAVQSSLTKADTALQEHQSLAGLALVNEAGYRIVLALDQTDYKLTASLYDKNGTLITTSNVVDFPIESVVVSVTYDQATNELVITLKNGTQTRIPLSSIISGLATETYVQNYTYSKSQTDSKIEGYHDLTKVDKVSGKELSTNDFTNTYKSNVDNNTLNRHTHANKSILDSISTSLINLWNTVTEKYVKPATGIPKVDLSSAVQTSLGKADTALQEHQSLSDYVTDAHMEYRLTSKSDTTHLHDGRYYTETEIDTQMAGKAAAVHTHDDRYYTETETDTLLSGKQNTIDSSHKLSSDLVDDINKTNKFVTTTDKTRFNTLNVEYEDTLIPGEVIDLSTVEVDSGGCAYSFIYDGAALTSNNARTDSTFAYGKITLIANADTTVTISVSQSSEAGYDFGIISVLDYELSKSINEDSGEVTTFNGRNYSNYEGSVTIPITTGEHFFTFKYRKDGSSSVGTDTFSITGISIAGVGFKGFKDYDTQEPVLSLPIPTPDMSNYYTKGQSDTRYITLTTEQESSAKKVFGYTEPSSYGGQETIIKILSTLNSTDMSNRMWAGRMMVGTEDKTFLMGVYNCETSPMCGIGAHKWSSARNQRGAAWEDVYIQPDGDKSVYLGGFNWTANSGWLRVKNTNNASASWKAAINVATSNAPSWKNIVANMSSVANSLYLSTQTNADCANSYCTSVGNGATATGNYVTNIGYNATSSGGNSTAIGASAHANASYAIQIGYGTNSTAKTLSIGLDSSHNYQLLNASGQIPNERLQVINDSSTTSTTETWSASKLNTMVGNIESALQAIRGV